MLNPVVLKQAFLSQNAYWLPELAKAKHQHIGWGRKPSGIKAAHSKRSFLLLEDGFLRSFRREDDTLSLCFDTMGIYYDARQASMLENMVTKPLGEADLLRTRNLMSSLRALRISKYNSMPEYTEDLPESYILVIDQVRGDASVTGGLADEGSFAMMLDAALADHPEKMVVVKTHPDRVARRMPGYFNIAQLQKHPRIRVIAEPCHPIRLIENAQAVYCVTSQIGFEALIWSKSVHCYGMPFYAGWGLTHDHVAPPDRRGRASLEQLVHAALIRYCRYLSPWDGQPCEAEDIVAYLGCQRRILETIPKYVHAIGFSRWKRNFLRDFVKHSALAFHDSPDEIDVMARSGDHAYLVWGAKYHEQLEECDRVIRVEDGFLRSIGLGASLVRPLSLVFDDVGIYFDATRPSRLENLLNAASYDQQSIERAKRLIVQLINAKVSKYNLPTGNWRRPAEAPHVILAVGQVESDASIARGSERVRCNADLLRSVRNLHPDAFIVYKPHPDVVAGLRASGSEDEAAGLCDAVIAEGDAIGLLDQVDEVHTITSLLGFEALLRGKSVTCHGLPFYAGWGLTNDRQHCERRQRTLSLEELVSAVLIDYPVYFDCQTGSYIEPERAIEQLAAMRQRNAPAGRIVNGLRRKLVASWRRRAGF